MILANNNSNTPPPADDAATDESPVFTGTNDAVLPETVQLLLSELPQEASDSVREAFSGKSIKAIRASLNLAAEPAIYDGFNDEVLPPDFQAQLQALPYDVQGAVRDFFTGRRVPEIERIPPQVMEVFWGSFHVPPPPDPWEQARNNADNVAAIFSQFKEAGMPDELAVNAIERLCMPPTVTSEDQLPHYGYGGTQFPTGVHPSGVRTAGLTMQPMVNYTNGGGVPIIAGVPATALANRYGSTIVGGGNGR